MAQLGYTWYPQDWWTSETFYDWEDYPMVRYAYREILDLLYANKGKAKLNQRIIKSRFRIDLNEEEYQMLRSKFDINDDIWTSEKVRIRLSKAESSRENGKLGGRPPKQKNDQKNKNFTQEEKPKNPELKPKDKTQETHLIKEKEKEKEKEKYKVKEKKNNARAIDFLFQEKQIQFEQFKMQNKNQVDNWNLLVENFNDKMDIEISQNKTEWEPDQIFSRLKQYTRSWISNQSKNLKTQNPEHRPPNRF